MSLLLMPCIDSEREETKKVHVTLRQCGYWERLSLTSHLHVCDGQPVVSYTYSGRGNLN